MNIAKSWREFFDGHAPVYNENCFTKNTVAEIDFLIRALNLTPGASVLDVGCGTGRHSIELARRGYCVTGVDISDGMLQQARKAALDARVQVNWRRGDAASIRIKKKFDAVICLCEGAFGLLGATDDPNNQPLAILRRVATALKPSAQCLFTVLNGFAMARRHNQKDVERRLFDPLTLAEVSECNPPGAPDDVCMRERGFVPTELVLLFQVSGLEVTGIWGGTAGNWGCRAIDLDEIEIMVRARKPEKES